MSAEYLAFGKSLALQAGGIMQSQREGRLRVRRKPDRTLVTDVDLAIQDLAIDAIISNFPGHTVIGEERSYGSKNAEHIWRIDPLDGTGEYIEGGDPSDLAYGFGLANYVVMGGELDDRIVAAVVKSDDEGGAYLDRANSVKASEVRQFGMLTANEVRALMHRLPARYRNRILRIYTPID